MWDTVQAFASSITGTLAAQAMLKGIGVGDKDATVLAATMTWLFKDGTGMLGRILFAWMKGSTFDSDAKRWRLFADILNDFAIFLEILAPSFNTYFIVAVCISGLCKSIVGVAGGATRAALTQHQARRNNMADVSAKDGSQETLVNLAGLVCSLILVPLVTGKPFVIWTLFIMFTMLHLFANYSAVTSVVMETLNQARLNIIVKRFLKASHILPVDYVNFQEPVVWPTRRKVSIFLGSSFQSVCTSDQDLLMFENVYKMTSSMYLLTLKRGAIHIVLHENSNVLDQLQSCFHAELINFVLENINNKQALNPKLYEIADELSKGHTETVVQLSHQYTHTVFPDFLKQLRLQGWETHRALLSADEWRANWVFTRLADKKIF
ncbi:RUS family member 1-like isoform X2 [Gigantopelta aegis]|nr:RUS family member 1-like isoform X2 [Gigantopelta aegis]